MSFDQGRLAALGRTEPFRRAYLGGTFDCFHRGHLALFGHAKKIARELVVSVNRDTFAAQYKRWPLMPLADRMAVLNSCRLVDRVVVNVGDADSTPAILQAQVDCIVHGSDWQGQSLQAQMGLTDAWLKAEGIELVILPYTPWTSTTALLEAYDERKSA